jgi:hypothetical protein
VFFVQTLAIPSLATLGVVTAMLEGADIKLVYALIPMLLLASFVLCGACGMLVVFCKSTDRDDRLISGGFFTAACVILALVGVAEIWPIVTDFRGDGIPVVPILVPLLIGAVGIVFFCCGLAVMLLKKSRSSNFQDLYTFEWTHQRQFAAASMIPTGAAPRVPNPMRGP